MEYPKCPPDRYFNWELVEDTEPVLVTFKSKYDGKCYLFEHLVIFGKDKTCRYFENIDEKTKVDHLKKVEDLEIVAWMFAPKPYQENKQKEGI